MFYGHFIDPRHKNFVDHGGPDVLNFVRRIVAVLDSHCIPISHPSFVITGFNTDVEFAGVTYHVQTEDKGLDAALVVSQVYRNGTIIATKRLQYGDLVNGTVDTSALAARLKKQHRLICAAIQTGRVDDLIALSQREAATGKRSKKRQKAGASVSNGTALKLDEPPIPIPAVEEMPIRPIDPPVVPVVGVIDVKEDVVLPPDAVAVVSQMAGKERPVHHKLCLDLVNESPFKSGEQKMVTFMVSRGTDRKVVDDAKIQVKILGSNFRPQILHTVTDRNGLAKLEIELPKFSSGRAAILIRASSHGEEVELRRPIAIAN